MLVPNSACAGSNKLHIESHGYAALFPSKNSFKNMPRSSVEYPQGSLPGKEHSQEGGTRARFGSALSLGYTTKMMSIENLCFMSEDGDHVGLATTTF